MGTKRFFFALRLVLLIALAYTLVLLFLPAANPVLPNTAPKPEDGVGGGLLPELIVYDPDFEEEDLEFTGMLEPEEYSRPRLLVFDSYKIKGGDTISEIAVNVGLNEDTLLSVNEIKNARLLQIDQILKIPNQDGIYHNIVANDTLVSISEKYKADIEAIRIVNEMFSDSLTVKTNIFVPGARMDWDSRQEINGDLFGWPVIGRITSPYGYRTDPFGGGRQFHYGIDIGAPSGAIVRAAMSGRVLSTAYNDTYGNHVVISHHSGYRTLYAHMSSISVKSGAYVGTGERIGLVGSTGLSTAPHLHFTVYKNGVTVNPRNLIK